MIYSIEGNLQLLEPSDSFYLAGVECGGITYEIKTSYTSAQQCPQKNGIVRFYTFLHTRDDALELFGFIELQERRCFQLLISVSGVGPKAALSILSSLSPSQLALCIVSGDVKTLTQCKGIGTKTAQRILLELKDRFGKESISMDLSSPNINSNALQSENASEAVNALVVLGYSKSEAASAVSSIDPQTSVEEMIKLSLKFLSSLS